ncbi:MAG: MMPL family transporter [Candidatus Competibacteraceae bacterium]|nr:MMPL family transporter [Candidatus Competibacteraceae bacterium]
MTFSEEDVDRLAEEVQRLEWNVIEIGDLSVAGLGENNRIVRQRNDLIREIFGAEQGKPGKEVFQKLIETLTRDKAEAARKLTALDEQFSPAYAGLARSLVSVDRHLLVSDLPTDLATAFLDKTGTRNLITIYPKAGVTDSDAGLRAFNDTLRQISPRITGMTPLSVDIFDEFLAASRQSAVIVAALVLIMTFLSMRSLRFTLTASVPVVVGMVALFGLLSLMGIKMNPMSLITLPLNIGIGIAYGVYMTQRFTSRARTSTGRSSTRPRPCSFRHSRRWWALEAWPSWARSVCSRASERCSSWV